MTFGFKEPICKSTSDVWCVFHRMDSDFGLKDSSVNAEQLRPANTEQSLTVGSTLVFIEANLFYCAGRNHCKAVLEVLAVNVSPSNPL